MQTPILYMAPLRGVTDHLFRTIFTRHFGGFDIGVKLIALDLSDLRGIATPDDIETMIADRLQSAEEVVEWL